jgi:GST-like protein
MIELYTYATANGQRVSLLLEETGLPYHAHKVDLAVGAQREPSFLKLSPDGQIPVIVDPHGPEGTPLVLSQSTAILIYLAEKSGRFLPRGGAGRIRTIEALARVMTDIAPQSATLFLLGRASDRPPPEIVAFFEQRLLGMLSRIDHELGRHPWLAGPEITIADLALYPTLVTRKALLDRAQGLSNLHRWAETMALRPGVARGMSVPG